MEVPRLWGQRKERRGGKDAMGFLERLVPGRTGFSSEDWGWGVVARFLPDGGQQASQDQSLLCLGRGYCVAVKPIFKYWLQCDFAKFSSPL